MKNNQTATFVIPHWRNDNTLSKVHLDKTLESIFKQTDGDWQIVIADDHSPCREAVDYILGLQEKHPGKIHVLLQDEHKGPGPARNAGIKWAYENASPFVLFNDADDISHARRLEAAREIFTANDDVDVVYSTFTVIDEHGNIVPRANLTESIIEILESHDNNPPQGENAWIDIGIEKGYTNLTSATTVRTKVAYAYPFPPEIVSEDQHAWLRYSAGGRKFFYTPHTPSSYRIPQNTGSVSRARIDGYYKIKARIDTEGFTAALNLAIGNKKIQPAEKDALLIRFYIKEGETMYKEKELELAKAQIQNALSIHPELTRRMIKEKGFENQIWTVI